MEYGGRKQDARERRSATGKRNSLEVARPCRREMKPDGTTPPYRRKGTQQDEVRGACLDEGYAKPKRTARERKRRSDERSYRQSGYTVISDIGFRRNSVDDDIVIRRFGYMFIRMIARAIITVQRKFSISYPIVL